MHHDCGSHGRPIGKDGTNDAGRFVGVVCPCEDAALCYVIAAKEVINVPCQKEGVSHRLCSLGCLVTKSSFDQVVASSFTIQITCDTVEESDRLGEMLDRCRRIDCT